MKLSLIGRLALASFAAVTLGLGMTGCGGGTIGFLWVLGGQYNQIAGFKIDDYTGNLTQIPHQPFSTNGVNPVSLVVKPGGRYVYVLNKGTGGAPGVHANSGNISVFSVGGDGTLTFQQSYVSQGYNSQWLSMDSTGSYLYVLDQYSPAYNGTTDTNGSITAYATDSSSGRLTLLQNTQSVANGQAALTYFEVGAGGTVGTSFPTPFMMKQAGNCLYTANATGILAFSFSGGQLVPPTTGSTLLTSAGATNPQISSIAGNGTFLTVTDTGDNALVLYTVKSDCSLTVPGGGGYYSLAQYNTSNPSWSLIENSGKYLYVTNKNFASTPTTANSSILAFTINQSTSQLQSISGSGSGSGNAYGTGSGPVCMVEDPTSQYIYTSNYNDGTISGKVIDNTTGILSVLSRGSSFDTGNKQLQCLVVSGSVN
jgi:6-phosphogluconolactonase (cycloisomerase 2 family)